MGVIGAAVEFLQYDPEDVDTYPSVCSTPEDVQSRFGFVGKEWLVFTTEGVYLGKLDAMVKNPQEMLEGEDAIIG